jgi:hypothetical protein
MSISIVDGPDGPPDSIIQNRLTIAGIILATLFFGGSFALQLHAQSRTTRSFSETFAYLEVAIIVGSMLAIFSIASLMYCQQCKSGNRNWYGSKRAWFNVATTCQYLALSQGLSAGLTELVFGVKHTFGSGYLAWALAGMGLIVWIFLLFIGPLQGLKSWWPRFSKGERLFSTMAYIFVVLLVLLSNGVIYSLQDGETASIWQVIKASLQQVMQPLMWQRTWAGTIGS